MATVTLSFDNGPDPDITPGVLDVLMRHGVAASFFVVGKRLNDAAGFRAIERAAAEGHWIGNHSYSHEVPFGLNTEPGATETEVELTQSLLGPLAHEDRLFRPFGGDGGVQDQRLMSRALVDHLRHGHYSCVLWNTVPRDWVNPEGWVEHALVQIDDQNEALVVLHDIVPDNDRQVDDFIHGLRDTGHKLVQAFPASCIAIARREVITDIEDLIEC